MGTRLAAHVVAESGIAVSDLAGVEVATIERLGLLSVKGEVSLSVAAARCWSAYDLYGRAMLALNT